MFDQFKAGYMRSRVSWLERISEDQFNHARSIGALEEVRTLGELHEFEDKFSIHGVTQEYKLFDLGGRLIARAIDGGKSSDVASTDLVFKARPDVMASILMSTVGFDIQSLEEGHVGKLIVGSKSLDEKVFLLILVLDKSILPSTMFHSWLAQKAKQSGSVLVMSTSASDLAVCSTAAKNIFVQATELKRFKADVLKWLAEVPVSFESLKKLHSDKDVVIDLRIGKLSVFGCDVKLEKDGKPLKYAVGLYKIAGTVSAATFASSYLDFYDAKTANDVVNRAKSELRVALKKAFVNASRKGDQAIALLAPTARKEVIKTLSSANTFLVE